MTPTPKDFAILKSQYTKMREIKDVLYEALSEVCDNCIVKLGTGRSDDEICCKHCKTGLALQKAREGK